jgi:hypothetical protein
VDSAPSNIPETTLSFTKELRQLKSRLDCAQHRGRHCYISPVNGEHIMLDVYKLTLWAKKIVRLLVSVTGVCFFLTWKQFLGDATFTQPPEILNFDHVPKKQRQSTSFRSATTSASPVQVQGFNDVLLGDQGGQGHLNLAISEPDLANLVLFNTGDTLITYPPASQVLREMQAAFPLLNMPQWEENLSCHGVMYADAIVELPSDFFHNVVGMPLGAIGAFRRSAAGLVRRAQKGKAKAIVVEEDGDDERPGS